MTLLIADRVREFVSVQGTSDVQLGNVVAGYQGFSQVLTNGDQTYYCIAINSAGQWEVGLGAWVTGNILQRVSIMASSNGGNIVSFFPDPKADVFIDLPAAATPVGPGGYLPTSGGVVTGNLGVSGQTTLSNLDVTGDTTLDGTNTLGPTTLSMLDVTGNTILQGNLQTDGTSTLEGPVVINSAATLNAGATINGGASVAGGLNVTSGSVSIEAGSLIVQDNVTVVVGSVNIEAGGLTVAGGVFLSNGGTLNGTYDLVGELSQTGTQYVTGAIVLNGTSVTTGGITSLASGTDINITGGNTINVTNVGSANGIAGLNSSGHVPLTQLPTEVQNITIGVTQVGTMSNSQLLSLIVATQTLVIPVNFGSVGANGVEICFQGTSGYPAASASVLFETGTVGSFTTQGTLNISTGGALSITNGPTAAVTISPGTAMAIVGQATADTALANFGLSYTVQRVGS